MEDYMFNVKVTTRKDGATPKLIVDGKETPYVSANVQIDKHETHTTLILDSDTIIETPTSLKVLLGNKLYKLVLDSITDDDDMVDNDDTD